MASTNAPTASPLCTAAGLQVTGLPTAGLPIGSLPSSARPHSVWGASDAGLSVRTDWSSDYGDTPLHADLPPTLQENSDSEGSDISRSLVKSLRSGRRHTRSRVLSSGKPINLGVHSIQNMRLEMEDAHFAVLGAEGTNTSSCSCSLDSWAEAPPLGDLSYFAVFDGHGGARAAEFCAERLYKLLVDHSKKVKKEPMEALRAAFLQTEEEWLTEARENEWMDGTTAAAVLVDRGSRTCVVGNVGDSEVLLGTRDSSGKLTHKILTEVHHLKRSQAEVDRIKGMGGRIWRNRLGHTKISPQVLSLAVSRAIGDIFFKDETFTGGTPTGLTAEPFIACTMLEEQSSAAEQFLLIGCDGLWDTIPPNESVEFVFSHLSKGVPAQKISEDLVQLARSTGSSDNITVILAVL